jgi:hypothetical protein
MRDRNGFEIDRVFFLFFSRMLFLIFMFLFLSSLRAVPAVRLMIMDVAGKQVSCCAGLACIFMTFFFGDDLFRCRQSIGLSDLIM